MELTFRFAQEADTPLVLDFIKKLAEEWRRCEARKNLLYYSKITCEVACYARA